MEYVIKGSKMRSATDINGFEKAGSGCRNPPVMQQKVKCPRNVFELYMDQKGRTKYDKN